MKILGIDTTRKSAKVFLIDTKSEEDMYILTLNENVKHSEGLFLYIEKTMLDNGISIGDVDVLAGVVGPGSFTGIRVGMSAIKGLNKVLNKSILSVNAFEIMATGVKNGYVMLNSTATSCYYAKIEKKNIVDAGVVAKGEIAKFVNGADIYILSEEQNLIDVEYNNIKLIDDLDELYKQCIIEKIDNMDYGAFVPYYLQLSQAERNLKNE